MYTYDKLGRLVSDSSKYQCALSSTDSLSLDGSGLGYACDYSDNVATYSYDSLGNRTDHSAVTGAFNRYSSFNGASLSYDADGNLVQRAKSGVYTLNFYWSSENHLDSLEYVGSVHTRYLYNAFGRPVVRYTKDGGPWAVQSYYIWDGDQLIIELDSLGHRKSDYTYFPGTIDNPAFETIGATSITAVRDFQIDATGSVIGTRDGVHKSQTVWYGAWGGPTIAGNQDNHLLWKGLMGEADAPVFLQYVRNRWYDPTLGRFISEDPIGHAGGENLYAFADNDPINGSDPGGLLESCSTQWVEFGSTDNGVITTHAYSFVACKQIGGGGGPPTLGGLGAPKDPSGLGSGGHVPATRTPSDEVGNRSVGVCRATIGLTAASFFLETVGAIELYKGAKALRGLRATARFAATFGSVPNSIQAYTRGRVIGAEVGLARDYASGWLQMSAIGYGTEAAAEVEHTWWGYLPVPYASTAAAATAAVNACFSPGQ